MSFLFGGGRPQPSSAEKIAAVETEMEMVSDMFSRLTQSCLSKCVPADYREADLSKGESVCLDRCVAKFFEVNMKVSEKMQSAAQAGGAAGGGGGGGMFGM
ncbi:protein transporter tim10 [Exophiala bonariae]|uniref:Mitochondrial import inner membrane translocase subunit n=1 Tax=Exophiala bonariae TaxID=1690606 RepID=A0AAV9NJX6_9EURO|nr:protein transporter tim10 [Exophiala bonariae]